MSIIHVVQISGGKDSQACAKLIRSRHPDSRIIGLFADTKFEHPITYSHVEKCADLYNLELITLNAGSVYEQVIKWGRFPGGGVRHCTQYLKIDPAKKWLINMAKNGDTIINYLGVRSDESPERTKRYGLLDDSLMMPHEVMPSKYPQYMGKKLGIRFCLPIIDWSTGDVFEYLNGDHNPLYDEGFKRVGCFPCLAGGDKSKMAAFKFDVVGESHYLKCVELSAMIKKPLFKTKIGIKLQDEKNEAGCAFCAM